MMSVRDIKRVIAIVAGPVVGLLLIDALFWYVQWRTGVRLEPHQLFAGLDRVRMIVLFGAAAVLGFSVVTLRHPVRLRAYTQWLRTGPWRRGVPLPLGSVHMDAVIALSLAAYVALAWLYLGWSPGGPLVAFGIGYVVAAAATLAQTGPRPAAVALSAGLGALALAAPNGPALALLTAALYALAWWGVTRSLEKFPWGLDERKPETFRIGWFVDELGPRAPEPAVGTATAVTLPLLIGWSLYCVVSVLPITARDVPVTLTFTSMAGALASLVRWLEYCLRRQPPISTWGRIRVGPRVIPGYDYVLLTPLAGAVVGVASPWVLVYAVGAPIALAIAVTAAATLLIVLNGPPTLAHWQLTGHYRLIAPPGAGSGRIGAEPAAVSTT